MLLGLELLTKSPALAYILEPTNPPQPNLPNPRQPLAVCALPFCPHHDLVRSSLRFIPQVSRQVNVNLVSLSAKAIFEFAIQNVANSHDVMLAVKLEDGDVLFLMKGLGAISRKRRTTVIVCRGLSIVFECVTVVVERSSGWMETVV